ncbi:MAG: protein kinase [Hyphomicrobiaceae bacterium]
MDTRLGLPVNTVLDGSYRITRVVGVGGFGITYEAEDVNLATHVAIKEYYPFDFGDRDNTMSVRPKSERHRQTFDWGRSNFLQEARTLARFEHPSIVRVTRVFEANSTAYMVMRFEQGQSLEAWLSGLGRPPTQDELDAIVAPLLAALEMMHASDFLHRDIAPDNIIVRADGSPVLLDFGAARRAVAEMSRTMTGIVKAGYSPHEQYSSDSRLQGPWSDLYALGGTLYRAVTGHPPEEATLRVDEDHMPTAAQAAWKGRYRPSFLAGIDSCLKVRHAARPRSVAQLRPMLLGKGTVSKPRLERLAEVFKSPSKPQLKAQSRPSAITGRTRRTTPPHVQPAAPSRRWLAITAAIIAVVGGAFGGYQFSQWDDPETVRRKAALEAQRLAEAKKKADEEAQARRREEERQAAERLAAERAREDAERKRIADAEAAKRRADEEARIAAERRAAEDRVRQDAERKRIADAEAAKRKADEEARIAAERRAAEERARQDVERRRIADAEAAAAAKRKAEEEARIAAEQRAADERARQEAERRRIADAEAAAAAKRKADEEARIAAEQRAAEERARQEAERRRIADADAARQREKERRQEQARREQEQRDAEAAAKKTEDGRREVASIEPDKAGDRSAAASLNVEQRAAFIRRVQAVLKDSQCYKGDVNGTSSDAVQEGLNKFVNTARSKGNSKPGRIELAKATANDFDNWLQEADHVKSGLCVAPKPQPKPRAATRAPRQPSRPQYRGGGGGGYGGGGGGAPIQGVR